MWMFKDNYERVDVERYCLSFEVLKIKAAPVTRLNLFQITLKITKDGKTSDASTHVREREIQKESKRKLNSIVAQLVNLHRPFCTLVTNCLFFSIHICTKDGIAFNQPTFAGEVLSNFDPRVSDRRGLEKINATSSKSGVGGFLIFEKFNNKLPSTRQRFSEGSQ